jgi:hypothetical protein
MDFNSRLGGKALNKLKREIDRVVDDSRRRRRPATSPGLVSLGGQGHSDFLAAEGRQGPPDRGEPFHASVHFKADKSGTDVVVLLGKARRVGRVASERRAAHLRKYRRIMKDPPSFQARFSVPIVFRPTDCAATERG